MKEAIDYEKVFLAVITIEQNLEIESVAELEREGLERICIENNIDCNDLSEEEKELVWKELIGIVEEIEFCSEFRKLYIDDE